MDIASTLTLPASDSVVVLAAGPSLNVNMPFVHRYLDKFKSTIIACNYNVPGISVDYTVFIGGNAYRHGAKDVKSPNFLVTRKIVDNETLVKKPHLLISSKIDGLKENIPKYWNERGISVSKDGVFSHHLSNCGFTALLAAHFFRPKQILIVGLDGPSFDRKSKKFLKVKHFTGQTRIYKGNSHSDPSIVKQKGHFLSLIFEFLHKKGITVGVCNNENLWRAREFPRTEENVIHAADFVK